MTKKQRKCNEGKIIYLTNGTGTNGHTPSKENESENRSYICHKKLTQNEHQRYNPWKN